MKVQVSEATELQLDYLVATIVDVCDGLEFRFVDGVMCGVDPGSNDICMFVQTQNFRTNTRQKHTAGFHNAIHYNPTGSWSQGGPIISKQMLATWTADGREWHAREFVLASSPVINGPTPLIAAMRCYVASKMGNEVEVPDELA